MSASTSPTYPVHVAADLDPRLSRWQWLVKWFLAIPHYLVLAFLWLAFVVLSVVAFFAILVTGRYPRSIFEFNVGVLRWSWRVAYYAYGALGTDRYPPFSLEEKPDYPAHLEVDYPEHLSRGLVLVKWWLLALPHYLVVAFFVGGAGWGLGTAGDADNPALWGSGLIGLLVLVAAVVLLFTGRYPKPVFDFVLGMNRWALRVAAYAALMTDRYPPFRLDQGGGDPDRRVVMTDGPRPEPPAPLPPSGGSPGSGWSAGRIVSVVLVSILALGSLGLLGAGTALAVADGTMRDDDGFLMSASEQLSTDTYALTSEPLEVRLGAAEALPNDLLGDLKVTADAGKDAVFLGIGRSADVDRYLDGVAHATVTDLAGPAYRVADGGAPTTPPSEQRFWVAESSGPGEQPVTWDVQDGDWTLVVMDADGGSGVEVEVAAGAELPALDWLVPLLLSVGGSGLVVSAVLLTVVVRGATR